MKDFFVQFLGGNTQGKVHVRTVGYSTKREAYDRADAYRHQLTMDSGNKRVYNSIRIIRFGRCYVVGP